MSEFEKNCDNCTYADVAQDGEPCRDCEKYSAWKLDSDCSQCQHYEDGDSSKCMGCFEDCGDNTYERLSYEEGKEYQKRRAEERACRNCAHWELMLNAGGTNFYQLCADCLKTGKDRRYFVRKGEQTEQAVVSPAPQKQPPAIKDSGEEVSCMRCRHQYLDPIKAEPCNKCTNNKCIDRENQKALYFETHDAYKKKQPPAIKDSGERMDDKPTIHAEICKVLNELYARKNADYGDSFAKLRSEIPESILVRVYDKYSRLKTLIRGAVQQVNDESIEDTLIDLANYCIMELVERRIDDARK